MARIEDFKMSTSERRRRRFSDNFKQTKVREIEIGKTKVSEISKQYQVSTVNVYRWIDKYGSMKSKKERLIVETQSDTRELLSLKKKVAELEQIIGQKQVQLDFKEKMIEIAEEKYGIEIKKKHSTSQFNTSGKTDKNSDSV
jgi:transposase-like protein